MYAKDYNGILHTLETQAREFSITYMYIKPFWHKTLKQSCKMK